MSRQESEESDNEEVSTEPSLYLKTRLLILNLTYSLLKRYDINETRFLKHPIASLNAFLESK